VLEGRPSLIHCRSQVRAGLRLHVLPQGLPGRLTSQQVLGRDRAPAHHHACFSVNASRARLRGAGGHAGNLHCACHWRIQPFRHNNPKCTHHPCAAPFNLLEPLTLIELPNEYNCGLPGAILFAYLIMSGTQLRQPRMVDDFSRVNSNTWAPSSANKWASFWVSLVAPDADIKGTTSSATCRCTHSCPANV
jgi:hypothetical protein